MGGAMLTFRNILGVVVMAVILDTGMSSLMFSTITIEKCLISITRLTKNTTIVVEKMQYVNSMMLKYHSMVKFECDQQFKKHSFLPQLILE